MNAINQLPADYMKVLYRALLNLFNETRMIWESKEDPMPHII
jgi:hypothetical protein